MNGRVGPDHHAPETKQLSVGSVGAATRALGDAGFAPKRVSGRGRSNIWEFEEIGRHKRVSIRTTKNGWFAFQPLKKGTKWKTLDDVDIVIVAAVDDCDDPQNVNVYRFDAEEVRKRFDASYAARIDAGQTVRDNFGKWLESDPKSIRPEPMVSYALANRSLGRKCCKAFISTVVRPSSTRASFGWRRALKMESSSQ
ncbi:MAG: hypothetical protein OXM87_03115 [Truepera sp.]|nr:hypothetical protein [Truepera sp.]